MQDIRIAAVSMNGFLGEPEKVLSLMDGWCHKAADDGAEFALFPELLVHGHCTPNTWELAEAVPDGESTKQIAALAKKFNLFLSVGLSEKENELVYNPQNLAGLEWHSSRPAKRARQAPVNHPSRIPARCQSWPIPSPPISTAPQRATDSSGPRRSMKLSRWLGTPR